MGDTAAIRIRDESALGHAVTHVPTARPGDDVDEVRRSLWRRPLDAVECVCVVGADGRLVGVAALVDVLAAPAGERIEALMRASWPRATAKEDQEMVAARAVDAGVSCVPIVDDGGLLLGIVPATALLAILRHEHVEDLHRLVGIEREENDVRSELSSPPTRRARHRLPWLTLGLIGSLGAAAIVARFEGVLEKNVALAFFVPMIVYVADAIGTQTEAIVVRSLSLSRLSLRQMLPGEMFTGALIGATLAALALPAVALLFGDVRIAIAVALAILAAGTVATTIGLLLPWCLKRLGSDPALGSGPLATIIQDVLSILIYFVIAIAVVT